MTVKRSQINGINYEYIDEGQGEVVLLLHGFPDSKKLWQHMIPRFLEAGYRVIAPDLRGFGNTDIADDYRIERSVKDMFDLLNTLRIKAAHVVGHDWGAFLGWYFSAFYPTVTNSFTALSVGHPNGYFRRGGYKQMFKGSYMGLFRVKGVAEYVLSSNNWELVKEMAESDRLKGDWLTDLHRPIRLTAGLNWYRHNLKKLPDIPSVKVPVMGLIGDNDPALTVNQMAESSRYVYQPFTYHVLKGQKHWLPETCPDEVFEHVVTFHQSLKQ